MKKYYMLLDKDGNDVLGGAVSEENVYIKTYGTLVKGSPRVKDLKVDESTKKRYSLSGQKPTVYTILRTV